MIDPSILKRVLPGPSAAPGAPIGNPANGPVHQMTPPAPLTHHMGIQPVNRGGANAGEMGTPWEGAFGSTLGRRRF